MSLRLGVLKLVLIRNRPALLCGLVTDAFTWLQLPTSSRDANPAFAGPLQPAKVFAMVEFGEFQLTNNTYSVFSSYLGYDWI